MSRINDKLGIKPAGKRSMMKLPKDRAAAVRLTAAICPGCTRRGANESRLMPGAYWCSYCNHTWRPVATEDMS